MATSRTVKTAHGENGFNTEKLISEVQLIPVLWQYNHKDYKNKLVTDDLWEHVGQKCNCTGAIAKIKWKNLKDSYRKRLHKIPSTNCQFHSKPVKIRWSYFDRMSFIKDFVAPSELCECQLMPNLKEETYVDEEVTDATDDPLGNGAFPSSPPSTSSASSNPWNSAPQVNESYVAESPSSPTFKRQRADISNMFLKLENRRLEMLNEQQNAPESSDLHFFRSLLPFMEAFTEIERLEVRGQIQQIVINKLREKQ